MALIKTSLIVAEIEATKIASLELKAPIGVGVDLKTGDLTKIVTVRPVGEPVMRPAIIPGKLINTGFLEARLSVASQDLETIIFLPIYSVTQIDKLKPEDQIHEVAEIEHLSISGLPDIIPPGQSGYKTKIIVRALLKIMITVTRESILSLPQEEEIRKVQPPSEQVARTKQTVSSPKRSVSRYNRNATWNRFWAGMHRKA